MSRQQRFARLALPDGRRVFAELEHEAELAVVIGRRARRLLQKA